MLDVQWNFTVPATLGTNRSGWISGQVFNVKDGSLNQSVSAVIGLE